MLRLRKFCQAFIGSSRGFTLVEVLIALAILGIVAVAFLSALATASTALILADERTTAESLTRAVGADVPLLGRDSTEEGYMVFNLDPDQIEQTFEHELGHQNYIVQVRDENGNLIDAEIDLNDWDVTIRLAEPMAGTVIIVNAELLG